MQEAAYHAVPTLVIPLDQEQERNGIKAVVEGFGMILQWKTINEADLFDAIVKLIYEPR